MLNKVNNLLRKPAFPLIFKLINLFIFFALVYYGLQAYSADPGFIKELRNTNIGNLIVWSYWWPVIILLSVFLGRVWCMVCPVETVTAFFAKFGLKLKRPKFMLSGWGITLFYAITLFIGIQGFSIHRNPFHMAVYLLSIFGVSVLSGIIFEKNTFCRYLCPVGYLLGVYSRFAAIGWRVKKKPICESCPDKSCIEKKYLYREVDKSCGVDLYPAKIDDNVDCILCAGCLKTCTIYNSSYIPDRSNPGFTVTGFAKGLFESKPLKTAEMFFVLIVSGFVISEIVSEWSVTNQYLVYVPDFLKSVSGSKSNIVNGLIYGLVIFLALPFLIWSLPFVLSKISGTGLKMKDYFINYGIAFIPVIAAAHVDKAILKMTSRLPYIEHLPVDLTGNITARMIIDKQLTFTKNPQWLDTSVSVLLVFFIAAGIFYSIKSVSKINIRMGSDSASAVFYLIPVIYGMIFAVMLIFWRWV
ncbi:MAG: 4Fe-4S binding protein [Ignavibacteriae bacterium]|nr:4Fe-4S binding protein [Ignavibacteriota bacterium]